MAKVVRFHETGGPEVLKIEDVEVPPPARAKCRSASMRWGSTAPSRCSAAASILGGAQIPCPNGIRGGGDRGRNR